MKNPAPKIKLVPEGVLKIDGDGEGEHIAAPISCEAYGTRVADNTKVAQITFVNFDGERLVELFNLSAFLPKNFHETAATLANKGYRWPHGKGLMEAILAAISAQDPDRRFTLVGAPGWYKQVYVTPDREYSSGQSKHREFVIDDQTGTSVAPFVQGHGSLEAWKKRVAKVAKKSSRLRLCIGAAFAATVLRPLGLDSFGLNLYSESSSGKTSCLFAAASVAGQLGERGLPGWGDSEAAVEQLMVGYRDGLLPLDETGDGDSKVPLAKKARALAFAIGRNRPRNLDKSYEKRANLTTRDCRNIILSSSERALGAIAMADGVSRLGGEEVRLIDVPASDPNSQGIFDKALTSGSLESALKLGQKTVDKLRVDAVVNQGYALHEFLRRYVNDRRAIETLKQYKDEFERSVETAIFQNSDRRIAGSFAAIHAAAALAIDYEILPWGKKSTRKAIRKCLLAALGARRVSANPKKATAAADLARSLKESLNWLDLIKVKKGERSKSADAERRKQADGFRVGQEIYVKPKRWHGIIAENKDALIEHKILRTERKDTITMARKVGGVPGKPRYIVINSAALDAAVVGSATRE